MRRQIKRGLFPCMVMAIFLSIPLLPQAGSAETEWTDLHYAARTGKVDEVRSILDKGIDINARNPYGMTALHWASGNNKSQVVQLLISRGADINAKTNRGWTALHYAVYNGYTNVVRFLLNQGADVNITDKQGKTPFQLAEEKNHLIIMGMFTGGESAKLALQPLPTRAVKSDVDELPQYRARPKKNSYAIVIGIEQYRQELPSADFAASDARTMTEYLTKAMGYPEKNVITLVNDRAAKSDMEKYFEKWLLNHVEKDGTVFIYYSGHGAPNPKTGDVFLVPYDGDPSFINETGYPLRRLYEALGKLPAKEIFVALDSCFSGGGGKSVIAKGSRPLVINLESITAPAKNMVVLSASGGDQISSTYDEKGHGLFTYFMLKGFKGEGDTNGDGTIEVGELFKYIQPQVEHTARRLYNNEQTPQLIAPDKSLERQKVF